MSVNKKSRREHLEDIREEKRTMVFYEAPHKLLRTLEDFYKTLGERPIALVREITKVHEQVWRTTLSEAIAHYTQEPPRGEFVLILGGKQEEETSACHRSHGSGAESFWKRAFPSAWPSSRRPRSWECPKTAFTTRRWSVFHKEE